MSPTFSDLSHFKRSWKKENIKRRKRKKTNIKRRKRTNKYWKNEGRMKKLSEKNISKEIKQSWTKNMNYWSKNERLERKIKKKEVELNKKVKTHSRNKKITTAKIEWCLINKMVNCEIRKTYLDIKNSKCSWQSVRWSYFLF